MATQGAGKKKVVADEAANGASMSGHYLLSPPHWSCHRAGGEGLEIHRALQGSKEVSSAEVEQAGNRMLTSRTRKGTAWGEENQPVDPNSMGGRERAPM